MFYLITLRMVAQRVANGSLESKGAKNPLFHLFDIYEETSKDGFLNWGPLFIFIAYAECFSLTRKEWNMLLDFINSKNPSTLPSVWTLIACLFMDMKS